MAGLYDPDNPIFGPRKKKDYGYLAQLEGMRRPTQRAPRQIRSQAPQPIIAPPRRTGQPSVVPGYGGGGGANRSFGAPYQPTPGASRPSQPAGGNNLLDIIRRMFANNPRPQPGPGAVAPGYGGNSGGLNTPYGAMSGGAAAVNRGGNITPSRSSRGGGDTDWSYLDQLDAMRNRPMPDSSGWIGNPEERVTESEGVIPLFGRTLADYLSGIDEESLVSEEMSALDAREQALRGQASAGDAELARIYQWLVNQIGGQDAQINQQYQQAQEQTRGNMRAATEAITEGGQATDSQLNEAFGNLGIERGAGSGSLPAGRQGQIGDVARQGQINADYMGNTGVNQRNLNRENRTAAGYRGAEERAAMQQQLAQFLAELQGERTNVRSRGRSMAQELAQAQYAADYGQYQDERNFAAGRDDQAWERGMGASRLQLDQQRLASQNQPEAEAEELNPFDTINQRLTQTQGAARADQIMNVLAEQARHSSNQNTNPGAFARRVHDAVAKLGLPPSAALEAHAAAEEFWQNYRD